MTIRRRVVLPLALAVLGAMVVAQLAGASHPRPIGASPLRVSLVPAFEQCTGSNRTHGPPLAFPSCNPPMQASDFLTVGTPDANGAGANSTGFARVTVNPASAEEELVLAASISDVRCKPGTAAGVCNNANATDGPDYSGELEFNATVRATDHFNATAPGGGPDPATMIDLPFPARMVCSNTADTSTGGLCNLVFGMCPVGGCSQIRDGDRTVIEFGQIRVSDGGQDGQVSTDGNTLFAVQGIFIP